MACGRRFGRVRFDKEGLKIMDPATLAALTSVAGSAIKAGTTATSAQLTPTTIAPQLSTGNFIVGGRGSSASASPVGYAAGLPSDSGVIPPSLSSSLPLIGVFVVVLGGLLLIGGR